MTYANSPLITWTLPSAGIVFNGSADADGNTWIITDETGWSATPAPANHRLPRPFSAGEFKGPNYRTARIISLTGFAFCASPSARILAERRLYAALQSGSQ